MRFAGALKGGRCSQTAKSKMSDLDVLGEIRQRFDSVDETGSGLVGYDGLCKLYEGADKVDIDQLMGILDLDGDGKVQYLHIDSTSLKRFFFSLQFTYVDLVRGSAVMGFLFPFISSPLRILSILSIMSTSPANLPILPTPHSILPPYSPTLPPYSPYSPPPPPPPHTHTLPFLNSLLQIIYSL